MAGGPSKSSMSTPPASTQNNKKSSGTQSLKSQKSILGFFSTKTATPKPQPTLPLPTRTSPRKSAGGVRSSKGLTPAPSSDGPGEDQEEVQESVPTPRGGLPSPIDSANGDVNGQTDGKDIPSSSLGTPTRKAKKVVNYAESASEGDDDEDEDAFRPKRKTNAGRATKRRKVSESAEEDNYDLDDASENTDDDDGFIVPDDSEDEPRPQPKRKRASNGRKQKSPVAELPVEEDFDMDMDMEIPEASTARQWTYDPEHPGPLQPRSTNLPSAKSASSEKVRKQKACMTEPDQRYTWLAEIQDMERNKPGSKDYDPRTLYIPPMAWAKFSPFEKQYWEIKQKLWDTIVFFKKGKFYELYENDATVGHQLFDLKLTDRVNMRMVGVPEMSLNHWANQFVAKGFKIARVDQQETALGKDMRERDEKANGSKAKSKEEKVIRRELACVLTAGTLVDGSMLQDDMATYCVSIKESEIDNQPAFGIVFVDTATGQFQMTEFIDDPDLTKFETFVAQTRPQELLLEKGGVSAKVLRILKNNTGLTTIWNYLKPGKEFWEGHITIKEIEASDYFPEAWPSALEQAKDKDLLMSAFGALLGYLRTLKIERDLVTIGNFNWYDPIKKASSLVLDGQTLINLEIFANSFDGGLDGTLFQLLNRCVTPFGKRMFKQWVCHPLMDTKKINARLDAVESLNADNAIRDRFSSQMTKMPDLERLISRIHAGGVKAQDFLRVLEGFEQIEYTISILQDSKSKSGGEDGVIGQLITSMPDLHSRLEYWKTAFDRPKAREHGILVPERGVEEDFDESQDLIESIHEELNTLLKKCRKDLGSSAICYRDNGKEIFQLEVPVKVKGIPKHWDQMSATKAVKRYYFPELRSLIRKLQETQETHGQIVKDVASRFYARFDEHYEIWLAAVKIMAQLDCLISLAKASTSLGQPSCRPEFVDSDRSILDLRDLRHPCLLSNVDDFIPNDINLGGSTQNITLLTGANAAGKSTVLRMTCVAVIMAQIGCYLPCSSAILTPFDRIMSRLGANDHIFAAQSTFFVELAETKKILSEATPRSLVILDELGRGTSSHDGVAVAQAVLHHLATHVGCLGFFATHYHSLAGDFAFHPEVSPKRMRILVDDENRRITFLYKLEDGVAEGSFGMHCASMCGIRDSVVERAEVAAKEWEHTSKLGKALMMKRMESRGSEDGADLSIDGSNGGGGEIGLGMLSDLASILKEEEDDAISEKGLQVLMKCIEKL